MSSNRSTQSKRTGIRVPNPVRFDADGYAQGTISKLSEVHVSGGGKFVFDVAVAGISDNPQAVPPKAAIWTSRYIGKDEKNGVWKLARLFIRLGLLTEAEINPTSAAAIDALATKFSDTGAIMAQIEGLWLKFRLYTTQSDNDADTGEVLPASIIKFNMENPPQPGQRVYVDIDSISVITD